MRRWRWTELRRSIRGGGDGRGAYKDKKAEEDYAKEEDVEEPRTRRRIVLGRRRV